MTRLYQLSTHVARRTRQEAKGMSQTAISQFRARKSNNKRKAEELYIKHESAGSSATRAQDASIHMETAEIVQENQGLAFMAFDIVEESSGSFYVWGKSVDEKSLLVRIDDFQPYFYVLAPTKQKGQPLQSPGDLTTLKTVWNRSLSAKDKLKNVEAVVRKPIMYFRPDSPDGSSYLKLTFNPGTSIKKVARQVHSCKSAVEAAGFEWDHADMHEHEVNLLQRFLVDTLLSSGCWAYLQAGSDTSGGWTEVPSGSRKSSANMEVRASWKAIQALTPDATRMSGWEPTEEPHKAWKTARQFAVEGKIAQLRLMIVSVQLAPADGKKRVAVSSKDPIVSITSILTTSEELAFKAESGKKAQDQPQAMEDKDFDTSQGEEIIVGDIGTEASFVASNIGSKVVMVNQKGCETTSGFDGTCGAEVRVYDSEKTLLQEWLALARGQDPDCFVTFQVKDNLGVLADRMKATRLEGGELHISRLTRGHSHPLKLNRIVQYSPNWVKNQQRMASNSNQETFKVDIDGRLTFDILRHVLTACSLASFSLSDCMMTLLGRTQEILPTDALADLAGLGSTQDSSLSSDERIRKAMRLARYSCSQALSIQELLTRMSTIPEALELARAAGLTASQAMYNAQMIRTHSLLLRTAQAHGFIIGGRQEPVQLQESPYLMHPVESNTVGLYNEPVCILDFASLYPSLFRAYNLSYDTLLVNKDDAKHLSKEDIFTSPTGDAFVSSRVRKGILPLILTALIDARATTRQVLKQTEDPAQKAVLDSRQKALKTTANALYGFTGAQASPLQCIALADSCLALGAMSCKKAKDVLDNLCASGSLGQSSKEGRVIYGQTDSIFCHFPNATREEAIDMGQQAADQVSEVFPSAMSLKYERICQPFLLLHVNRYAGRAYETESQVAEDQGVLMVKGVKSMWRQTAPLGRNLIQGLLQRIIMKEDVKGGVRWAEGEVRRLLEGNCELWEFVMTGGLWRITGQQVEKAAAGNHPKGEDGDVRGPHASLAVRLQQRDSGRNFVLGERVQYILLSGHRTQDEAAEDPLTAGLQSLSPDYELYWRNKLMKPLQEIFATCLSISEQQAFVNGAHTKVKVDVTSPEKSSKGQKGLQQTGLSRFYRATVRCLACKRPIPKAEVAGKEGREPGLCRDCRQVEGRLASIHLSVLSDLNTASSRAQKAHATCVRCHSGKNLLGPLLCENGECAVLYTRLSADSKVSAAQHNLQRLDW